MRSTSRSLRRHARTVLKGTTLLAGLGAAFMAVAPAYAEDATLGFLSACPEMQVRRDGVAAPDDDQPEQEARDRRENHDDGGGKGDNSDKQQQGDARN